MWKNYEYMKTKLCMIFITKSMDSKFMMLEKMSTNKLNSSWLKIYINFKCVC